MFILIVVEDIKNMNESEKEINKTVANKMIEEAEAVAKNLVDTAARNAKKLLSEEEDKKSEERMTRALSQSLRDVFSENVDTGRFIDVSRVPLICLNINNIHESLKDIKENMVSKETFWPIKTMVYAGAGTVLLAVLGAVVALVVIK